MTWESIHQAADETDNFQPAVSGFTDAKRGLISVPGSDEQLFVKIAVDTQTAEWIAQEVKAYQWLRDRNYPYAPELIDYGSDGFALPDLSDRDWSNNWDDTKVNAALRATDSLAELSRDARGIFKDADFGSNPWLRVSGQTSFTHLPKLDSDLNDRVQALLSDTEMCAEYQKQASNNPEKGTELVHYDVRADNFAYDPEKGEGLLVDWSWLCLGSKVFDQTAFLIDVHKHFNVLDSYQDKLDKASLAWLISFWIDQAAQPTDSDKLNVLKIFQLESALRAHDIYTNLTRS